MGQRFERNPPFFFSTCGCFNVLYWFKSGHNDDSVSTNEPQRLVKHKVRTNPNSLSTCFLSRLILSLVFVQKNKSRSQFHSLCVVSIQFNSICRATLVWFFSRKIIFSEKIKSTIQSWVCVASWAHTFVSCCTYAVAQTVVQEKTYFHYFHISTLTKLASVSQRSISLLNIYYLYCLNYISVCIFTVRLIIVWGVLSNLCSHLYLSASNVLIT